MRLRRLLPLGLLAVVALTGCGDSSGSPGPTQQSTLETFATTAPAETATAGETGTAGGTQTAGPSAAGGEELTVTVGGQTEPLSPDEVLCSGEPGHITGVTATTGGQPPTIEVDGGQFVSVDLGEGDPYVSETPVGMSYLEDGVTFDGVSLGRVVLDGSMTCTDWQS